MNSKEIAHLRLVIQGIHGARFNSVPEVVETLGAVQAQDYLGSLWGIGLRMKAATESTIEKAIADKKIVRSWPMRGTLHFTTATDLRWMLLYLAPRVLKRAAGIYRQAGLDAAVFKKSTRIIVKSLEGGNQLTRDELYTILEKNKIDTKNVRGLHILGYVAQQGLICFGTRSGKQHRFALVDEWLPPADILLTGDEALAALTMKYFIGHGPATLNDFAWWAGLTQTEAKRGLSIVEGEMEKISADGKTFWMRKDAPEAKPAKTVYLLPAYDEYTVAYKDRSILLDAKHAAQAKNGIFTSVIVADGKIAGTWKRTLNKDHVLIEKEIFKSGVPSLSKILKQYSRFLEQPVKV